MHKATHKLAALLAVLAMAVGIFFAASPAIAAPDSDPTTGTLTVTSDSAEFNGKTVTIYKMFDVTVTGSGDEPKHYGYTLEPAWKSFFIEKNVDFELELGENPTDAEVSDAAYLFVSELTETSMQEGDITRPEFASMARDWVVGLASDTDPKPVSQSTTAVSKDGKYAAEFENIALGYYVVSPQGGSIDANRDTDAMLQMVTDDNAEVDLKSEYPTVTKQVKDDGGEAFGDHASVEVGDTLTFTLTATVPDVSSFTHYIFNLQDTLSDGLTFNDDSLTVKINESVVYQNNEKVDDALVSVDTSGDSTFTVNFGAETTDGGFIGFDAKDYFASLTGQTIVVEYTATVNSNAVTNAKDEFNKAKVQYSTNPGGEQTGTSTEDQTHQYTFGFDITKVDAADNNTVLTGAEFQLKKSGPDGAVIKLIETSTDSNTYRPAMSGEDGVETVAVSSSGKLAFVGLDEGTYELVETKAPDGYNLPADPFQVVIDATYDEDGTLSAWSASLLGTKDPKGPSINIENSSGIILPGTGGMGTVIFTVVGVAVIAGGALWLVSRNRRVDGAHTA